MLGELPVDIYASCKSLREYVILAKGLGTDGLVWICLSRNLESRLPIALLGSGALEVPPCKKVEKEAMMTFRTPE